VFGAFVSFNRDSDSSPNVTSGTATVNVDKTYFYSNPDLNSRRSQYLVRDQVISFTKSSNGFLYGSFTWNGKTTTGWVHSSDFSIQTK